MDSQSTYKSDLSQLIGLFLLVCVVVTFLVSPVILIALIPAVFIGYCYFSSLDAEVQRQSYQVRQRITVFKKNVNVHYWPNITHKHISIKARKKHDRNIVTLPRSAYSIRNSSSSEGRLVQGYNNRLLESGSRDSRRQIGRAA